MISEIGMSLRSPKPECADCAYVSRTECQAMMECVSNCVKEHEERLNKKDVQDGKMLTKLGIQTWLLSGIFGITLLSFLANIFADFMK